MRVTYFYWMKREPEPIRETVPEHVSYWHGLGLRGYLGGPYTDRTGGLILFDIDAVEEAERLVAGDPLVRAEVLDSWQVKQWEPE